MPLSNKLLATTQDGVAVNSAQQGSQLQDRCLVRGEAAIDDDRAALETEDSFDVVKSTNRPLEYNDLPEREFQIRVITSDADFESLKESWNRLTDEPLRSFVWSFAWWKSFGAAHELQIFVVTCEDSVVGIAPFFVDQWLGCRRLRFIGSGTTCTDYAQVIAAPIFREAVVDSVASQIRSIGTIQMVELEGVSGEVPEQILGDRLACSFWCYKKDLQPTWLLELPDTWDAFVATAKKSLRRKIRKAEKRFESGQAVVQSTSMGLSFESAFDVLVDLHQMRFESKGEPGVFGDQRFTNFLRPAIKSLVEEKKAEIIVTYVDEHPIGVQLYLLSSAGPQLYQAGVDVNNLHFEPGHLLFTYSIRKAIQSGFTTFDFLRGDESYKPFWGATPELLSTVRYVSNDFTPTVVNRSYRLLRNMKQLGQNWLAERQLAGQNSTDSGRQ